MKFFIGIFVYFSLLCPVSAAYVQFVNSANEKALENEIEETAALLRSKEKQRYPKFGSNPNSHSIARKHSTGFSQNYFALPKKHKPYNSSQTRAIRCSVILC